MLVGLDKFEYVIDPKEGTCGARADFGESTLSCFGAITRKSSNGFSFFSLSKLARSPKDITTVTASSATKEVLLTNPGASEIIGTAATSQYATSKSWSGRLSRPATEEVSSSRIGAQ